VSAWWDAVGVANPTALGAFVVSLIVGIGAATMGEWSFAVAFLCAAAAACVAVVRQVARRKEQLWPRS
jgi:nitrate/nitrite transporter NarK